MLALGICRTSIFRGAVTRLRLRRRVAWKFRSPIIKVALAVSGGVDSMALAFLSKTRYAGYDPIAFIVDHKLRPNSSEECEQVQKNLRNSVRCSGTLGQTSIR